MNFYVLVGPILIECARSQWSGVGCATDRKDKGIVMVTAVHTKPTHSTLFAIKCTLTGNEIIENCKN